MTIRAVLFDMDGVLIDAKEWHYEALNSALRVHGEEISRADHLTRFDGLPTRAKLKILSRERGLPPALHESINDLKQRFTNEYIEQKCRPTLHHQHALSRLKNEGYRLGLCSNSIRETVHAMMNLSQLEPYLEVMLSNEDVQSPKPAPDIYNKAIAFFDLHPSECLILEDNDHGIAAARAAGAHVMTVAHPNEVTYDKIKAFIAACPVAETPALLSNKA